MDEKLFILRIKVEVFFFKGKFFSFVDNLSKKLEYL